MATLPHFRTEEELRAGLTGTSALQPVLKRKAFVAGTNTHARAHYARAHSRARMCAHWTALHSHLSPPDLHDALFGGSGSADGGGGVTETQLAWALSAVLSRALSGAR